MLEDNDTHSFDNLKCQYKLSSAIKRKSLFDFEANEPVGDILKRWFDYVAYSGITTEPIIKLVVLNSMNIFNQQNEALTNKWTALMVDYSNRKKSALSHVYGLYCRLYWNEYSSTPNISNKDGNFKSRDNYLNFLGKYSSNLEELHKEIHGYKCKEALSLINLDMFVGSMFLSDYTDARTRKFHDLIGAHNIARLLYSDEGLKTVLSKTSSNPYVNFAIVRIYIEHINDLKSFNPNNELKTKVLILLEYFTRNLPENFVKIQEGHAHLNNVNTFKEYIYKDFSLKDFELIDSIYDLKDSNSCIDAVSSLTFKNDLKYEPDIPDIQF